MAQWQGLGRYPENADQKDCPAAGELLAYVDGSYQDALKKYGFGCIFILPDGRIYTEYGNGDNPDSLKQRNVSGEMLGAMYAVRFALNSGFRAILLPNVRMVCIPSRSCFTSSGVLPCT
jgi:ribonuclease H-related protein